MKFESLLFAVAFTIRNKNKKKWGKCMVQNLYLIKFIVNIRVLNLLKGMNCLYQNYLLASKREY